MEAQDFDNLCGPSFLAEAVTISSLASGKNPWRVFFDYSVVHCFQIFTRGPGRLWLWAVRFGPLRFDSFFADASFKVCSSQTEGSLASSAFRASLDAPYSAGRRATHAGHARNLEPLSAENLVAIILITLAFGDSRWSCGCRQLLVP